MVSEWVPPPAPPAPVCYLTKFTSSSYPLSSHCPRAARQLSPKASCSSQIIGDMHTSYQYGRSLVAFKNRIIRDVTRKSLDAYLVRDLIHGLVCF